MERLINGQLKHESWREYAEHSLLGDNLDDSDLIKEEELSICECA